MGSRWRIIRTSNAYEFRDPLPGGGGKTAAMGGHHTICSKSYAKPKAQRNQSISQTVVYAWIGRATDFLRFFLSESPFKIDPKGKQDFEGQRARNVASLACDFEQIVW
jgi:hypothetical protein